MARTPGSKFSLLLLLLAVLPAGVWAAPSACGRGDSHSLHYDFNISSHQHPWCMVHVQLEKGKYLSYDCGSNKVIAMNILREAGKAMDSCKEELGTLSDMGNELKPLLPDIKQEKYADGAPFTLQVRMTCQGKADGGTCGFLEFFLDGQRLLTFDSETEKYRADNSVDEWLKKKLENDKDLTNFFKITLNGDCKILYQCWVHWKTVLETTGTRGDKDGVCFQTCSLLFPLLGITFLLHLTWPISGNPSIPLQISSWEDFSPTFLVSVLLFSNSRNKTNAQGKDPTDLQNSR
ncbi:hypothetical protein QTO34_001048 [Cnephaeus nilssonii]|uniref:MHC class I-like antigen recognition-like domain-containing protein n=1 Tax=Cnephaeus nilssonii TaxID=3371016 RepID=A0AA40HV77_CNENI|nr:hypothetical protein QTO34_001048 [Eptesicus nilssonii]